MSNINNNLQYIQQKANSPATFVELCEGRYNRIIETIAKNVAENEKIEIIMLAGPSSAGKTTTAKKIREALKKNGVNSYAISLDDFYLNNCDAPRFPDGTPDFETVHALDIPFFYEVMKQILETGEADIPEFDFLTGKRKEEFNHIKIQDREVIIVEGLHALNPIITKELPSDRLFKIYINVSSRIYDNGKEIVLNKRNMRFVRRLVRDYNFRGNSVERTLEMWVTVRYGEDTYLFPYRHNADVKINTIHLYETCVLKDTAINLLKEVKSDSGFYKEAQRLIRNLEKFPSIDKKYIPENSLMREFVKF
jgi:uridine kinase